MLISRKAEPSPSAPRLCFPQPGFCYPSPRPASLLNLRRLTGADLGTMRLVAAPTNLASSALRDWKLDDIINDCVRRDIASPNTADRNNDVARWIGFTLIPKTKRCDVGCNRWRRCEAKRLKVGTCRSHIWPRHDSRGWLQINHRPQAFFFPDAMRYPWADHPTNAGSSLP